MFEAMQGRIVPFLLRIGFGVVAGLALLWVTFVPSFGKCGCRLNANESAAIATLKNIHSGQSEFHDAAAVDSDHDGHGEYGWFGELAGSFPARDGEVLLQPRLSAAFSNVEGGRVTRSGYLFQIWLPAKGGGWVTEGDAWEVDGKAAETTFRCLAWPLEGRGKRAFFVNAEGTVYACGNSDFRYQGNERPVPVQAAVAAREPLFAGTAIGPPSPGEWVPVQ